MTARYAIYYTPAADDPLTMRAAAWLGRDAFTDRSLARPRLPGLEALDLEALTASPRGYGFHATLKAPFELAPGAGEGELLDFAAAFAARRTGIEAAMAPARLGRFLAFRLAEPSAEIADLHEACVREFDRFRAPLSDFDLTRRRKAGLTPEQEARLLAWGYPYVFEDFRFHMTLTGSLADEGVSDRLLKALNGYFVEVSGRHCFDGVGVFVQENRGAPFRVLSRFAFQASPALSTAVG